MRAQQELWSAYRKLAAREAGLMPGQSRVLQSQALTPGQVGELMRLPVRDMDSAIYDAGDNLILMLDYDGLDEAPLG